MSHYLSKKGQKLRPQGNIPLVFLVVLIAIVGKCYPTSVKLRLFEEFSHPK